MQVHPQVPVVQVRVELSGPAAQGVQLVPQESTLVLMEQPAPHWW